MVDVSIVNETSPEANWNRQTGKPSVGRQRLQKVTFAQLFPSPGPDAPYIYHVVELSSKT